MNRFLATWGSPIYPRIVGLKMDKIKHIDLPCQNLAPPVHYNATWPAAAHTEMWVCYAIRG